MVRRCGSCEAGVKVITSNIFILHSKFCSTTTAINIRAHIKHFYVCSLCFCVFRLLNMKVAYVFYTVPSGDLHAGPIYWCQKVSVCSSHKFIIVLFCVHFLVQLKCFWTVKHGNIFWHQYCIFSTEEAGYFTTFQLGHQIAK